MDFRRRWLPAALVVLFLAFIMFLIAPRQTSPAFAQSDWRQQRDDLLTALRQSHSADLNTSTARQLGNLSFVRFADGHPLVRDGGGGTPAQRALAFLTDYGALLGLTDPSQALTHNRDVTDSAGNGTHARFAQRYHGIPVFGAELVVHMNADGITALNGFFIPEISVNTQPTISESDATRSAVAEVKRVYQTDVARALTSLYVYRTGLLEGYAGENHLAYAVEVEGGDEANPVKEQVWVDAHTGTVLNRVSLIHNDLYRIVYSPTYDPANPNQNIVREEGDPPVLPVPNPFDKLYDFSGQLYSLFDNAFERDSYDGLGAVMRTVYLVNDQCPNAYWNGQATHYCPGFDLDDVVAHEWGHAYTQFTHDLIYQYQAGAMNESYSDIWGETLDLHNGEDGAGGSNNTQVYPAGQRWLVGEDLGAPAQMTLLRNMWDPETHPVQGPDPARVQSPNYYCGSGDSGGVHSNSGIGNHTFAMLVDGKNYNGQSVTGIGFVKATHIYFRASTVYQISTSGYPEHADALEASCNDMIGQPLKDFQTGLPSTDVISAADCQEVEDAVTATELRLPPLCDYQPILDPNTPAICSGAATFFSEDWESGTDGWTLASEGTGDDWPDYNWVTTTEVPDPYTGTAIFAANEVTGTCAPGGDISGHFTIDSPQLTIPASGAAQELRFDHYIATELLYDGGNLKASVNGGAFTVVPSDTFIFNPYNEMFDAPPPLGQNTNPLAGEEGFTGTDEGTFEGSWGTSIVNLGALGSPGDTLVLRWDFGVDGCNGVIGWYVDNINAYTCGSTTPTPSPSPTVPVTPSPTATQAPPTITPFPTPSPDGPTNTPLATVTPSVTNTPGGPTQTPTTPPTPSATITPGGPTQTPTTPPTPSATITPGGPTLTPTVPPTASATITPGGPTLTPTTPPEPAFRLHLQLIQKE